MVFSDISRRQAFLAHLAVSACVFVVISYLIVFHWFPDYYFFLDGGTRAIATIFFVDVVLGPSLTLLLFRPDKKSKKELKLDMAAILLLQLSALAWGVSNVYAERPGATVFYLGKFTCITHNDTSGMNVETIVAGAGGKQRLTFLQRPDTVDEFLDFIKDAYRHNSSAIYYYQDKIVPLDERVVKRLQNYKINLYDLAAESEEAARKVDAYIDAHNNDIEYIHLIPLSGRYGSAIAVYDTRELKITDWLDVQTNLRAQAQDEPLPLKLQIPDYSM